MYTHNSGLTLSKIEENDITALKQLKDESWFGTHTVTIINRSDQKRWFENTRTLVLKATHSMTEAMVGIFKIDNVQDANRQCDVGWDILSEQRGNGYGKKIVQAGVDFCFEILNMHRLNAEILQNNVASKKCAIAAGFVKEGTKRAAIYKCGEYIDSQVYGILDSEWIETKVERYGEGFTVCNTSYTPKDGK